MRVVACLSLGLLAGCADPAVLDVIVSVEEKNLEQLVLKVSRGPEATPHDVIDCVLPLGADPTGTCPFEGGDGQWEDDDELRFILYGKPNTELFVSIEGERLGRSVTATQAITYLGGEAGERRSLSLALFGLTRERFRCSVELADPPNGEAPTDEGDQTSLSVLAPGADIPIRPVIASVRGGLHLITYGRTQAGGCALEDRLITSRTAADRWCPVVPGSLVTARSADNFFIAAATCATGARPRIKAALFARPLGSFFERAVVRDLASPPALADLNGDGTVEVVFITDTAGATAPDPVLGIWSPRNGTEVLVPLTGVVFDGTPPAPIVVKAAFEGTTDPVLIAGGRGSFGYVATCGQREGFCFTSLGTERAQARAPIAVVRGDEIELYQATTDGMIVKHRLGKNGRTLSKISSEERMTLGALATGGDSLATRLAFGPVDAGAERLLIGDAGFVQLYDQSPTGLAVARDLWNGAIGARAQTVLLANIDRQAGAEIISFDSGSSQIFAADAGGRAIDGWPLSITGQSGRRHVVVTDLNPPTEANKALGDLEVVTLSLSARQVEVITLGSGSYDPASLPWPFPAHDAAGSATYSGAGDPAFSGRGSPTTVR